MPNVVAVVSKLVNVVRSKGRDRQVEDFLSDMESEYGDIQEVRWLSHGRILKHVYVLKSETELSLKLKGAPAPQLCDHDWMCDFCVLHWHHSRSESLSQ